MAADENSNLSVSELKSLIKHHAKQIKLSTTHSVHHDRIPGHLAKIERYAKELMRLNPPQYSKV